MPLTRITTRSVANDTVGSDDLAPDLVLTGTVVTAPTIALTGTSAITLPKGTTAQRGTSADGMRLVVVLLVVVQTKCLSKTIRQ